MKRLIEWCKNLRDGEKMYILTMSIIGGLMIVGSLLGWVVFSYFEARAYTRLTGKEVSITDAMFLELRIIEGSK